MIIGIIAGCSKEKVFEVTILGSRGKYISFIRREEIKAIKFQYGILDREVEELKKLRGQRVIIKGKELDPLTFQVNEMRKGDKVIYKKKKEIKPIPVVEPSEAMEDYYIIHFEDTLKEESFQPTDGYAILLPTMGYEEFAGNKYMPISLLGKTEFQDGKFWLLIQNGKILLDIRLPSKLSLEREKDREDFLLLQLATVEVLKKEKIKVASYMVKIYGVIIETKRPDEYEKTKILGTLRVYKIKHY